jgi:PTS system galactitol-specific IIA component
MKILFYEDIHGDKKEILTKISEDLFQKGYVKASFKEALLKRETEFPTGLDLGDGIAIALPHTDTIHVNEEIMVIIIPSNQVKFALMDDPTKDVNVSVIFLLLIKDPQGYTKFLSKLVSIFQTDMFKSAIKNKDVKKIQELIEPLIQFR